MKLKSLFNKLKISINNDRESETQTETVFNISDLVTIKHKNCHPWCKECVPSCIIEGWTSGNSEIDKFIMDTIYDAKEYYGGQLFLEWVPFDKFEDIKQIGEGGFAKVYSANWIDSRSYYTKQSDGIWKKLEPK